MQKHGDRKDTALLVILTNHDALKGVCYKKQFSSKQRAATTLGRRILRFALIGPRPYSSVRLPADLADGDRRPGVGLLGHASSTCVGAQEKHPHIAGSLAEG